MYFSLTRGQEINFWSLWKYFAHILQNFSRFGKFNLIMGVLDGVPVDWYNPLTYILLYYELFQRLHDIEIIFGARSFENYYEMMHTMSKSKFIHAMSIRTFPLIMSNRYCVLICFLYIIGVLIDNVLNISKIMFNFTN